MVQRGGVWALAHLTRKIVSEMTYNVSSGTLNTTILYYTILYYTVPNVTAHPSMASVPTSYYLMCHYNCLWTPKA